MGSRSLNNYGGTNIMASKIKVDQIQTADGTGTIALQNQLSGMTGASMPTGAVLQVVNSNISSQVVVTSTSPTDIGLSATITPSSTSSKIIVIATASVTVHNNSDTSGAIGWSITDSSNNIIIGSQGDSQPFDLGGYQASNWYNINGVQTKTIVHSPSTTSAFTYKMRGENGTATNATFNYNGSYGATSSIILMEVKG